MRTQVKLGPERVVPLARFRGAGRPVLLAGSQGYIGRCLKAAELLQTELRARGVSVVPLPLSSADPAEKLAALKREFRWGLQRARPCHHMLVRSTCIHEAYPRETG